MQELQAHQQLEASHEKDQGVFTLVFIKYNFFRECSFNLMLQEVLSIHYNHNQHINLHLNLILIGLIHRYFEEITILVTYYFIDKSFILGVVYSFIRISCLNCLQLEVLLYDSEPLEEVQASIIVIIAIIIKEEEAS